MSESTNPTPSDQQKADETFTWTDAASSQHAPRGTGTSTAASILDSVREVVDELAERAAPTVRELSARAAELTAIAADRAAPLARRAGDATADASGKLAAKSRGWASDLRSAVGTAEPATEATPHREPPRGEPGGESAAVNERPTATGEPGPS